MSEFYAYITLFDGSNEAEWKHRKDMPGRGILKIGRTDKQSVEERVSQQFKGAAFPNKKESYYKILQSWSAVDSKGRVISDKQLYDALKSAYPGSNVKQGGGKEWYEVTLVEADTVIRSIQTGIKLEVARHKNYGLRPEQSAFIEKASNWYLQHGILADTTAEERSFLLNGKMRFGKTFASLKLCQNLNFTRVLVLTHKPSVRDSWFKDWSQHVDFKETLWIDSTSSEEEVHRSMPHSKLVIAFYSYQDLGNSLSVIKKKHEWLYKTEWDLIINDEYHFGAWNQNSKDLIAHNQLNLGEAATDDAEELLEEEKTNSGRFTPGDMGGIKARYYLYLSGTPFRSLETEELTKEQIFSWTYADEQRAKKEYKGADKDNPYSELPKMAILTYNLSHETKEIALEENGWFNLNKFFLAYKDGDEYKFKNELQVSHFIEYLWDKRALMAKGGDDLDGIEMPFKNKVMREYLAHTFWLLPSVASVYAMKTMLEKDDFFNKYTVVPIAGPSVGAQKAIELVEDAIASNPRTITLSCGKLTTGSTVPEWTGVFMFSGISTPESYMQTAFRAGTPWYEMDYSGSKKVYKEIFYVFDFSPNRTLKKVYDLAKLQMPEKSISVDQKTEIWDAEKAVAELVRLLPIYSFDGAYMQQLDAESILEVIEYGTTNEILAKRWRSPSLISLSNKELKAILNDEYLMSALAKIIQHRKAKDIPIKDTFEKVINREQIISKSRENAKKPPKKTEAEKQAEERLKEMKEKLNIFIQRIPAFMYVTDERERTLVDVVNSSDGNLFEKTTGLTINEFARLYQAGVFNAQLISDLIWRFRNFENNSFSHMGEYNAKRTEVYGGMDREINSEDAANLS
jgi:hypothetical protein